MAEKVIVPEMDLSGIISESRDVAQALNSFADELEKIEKKYAKVFRDKRFENEAEEEGLCYSCVNKGCWLSYQYGVAKSHCEHYEEEK